jgi:L-lactate dehydrogenase
MAYKIIELKKATYYGIGTALAKIVKAVLQDLNIQLIVGAKLNGEYGCTGVYTGVPAIIGKNGISKIIE